MAVARAAVAVARRFTDPRPGDPWDAMQSSTVDHVVAAGDDVDDVARAVRQ
ncbi:MAG: hypothetical protein JXO72_14885 [Vicinamibacteria bacterium]|nr:hypothetical protein [Vicinamibacteria bacterium]